MVMGSLSQQNANSEASTLYIFFMVRASWRFQTLGMSVPLSRFIVAIPSLLHYWVGDCINVYKKIKKKTEAARLALRPTLKKREKDPFRKSPCFLFGFFLTPLQRFCRKSSYSIW